MPTAGLRRYGVKLEAVQLVREWVSEIASCASGGLQRADIMSGAIGAPESRLELELTFARLADLEAFWGSIPADAHAAWSKRLQVLKAWLGVEGLGMEGLEVEGLRVKRHGMEWCGVQGWRPVST